MKHFPELILIDVPAGAISLEAPQMEYFFNSPEPRYRKLRQGSFAMLVAGIGIYFFDGIPWLVA